MRIGLRKRIYLLFSFAFVAMLLVPAAAFALEAAPDGTSPPAPTIQSDKADYAPGELVTLTGGNWQPGESVHIYVNDDQTRTWERNVDVTADENGNIRDEFNLPNWFVATYQVTATGSSGAVATTSFTDGTVRIKTVGTSTAATIAWTRYRNPTCTPLDESVIDFGSISAATTNNGTSLPVDVSGTQSVRLSAPATLGGANFDRWTNGNFTNPSFTPTSNPGCLTGSSNTQNTAVNYKSANQAPTANANGPYSVNEGGSVQLNGSGSDPDGTISSYAWDLDNNGSFETSGQTPTFSAAGIDGPASRTVVLRVTDNGGATATSNATVNVTNVAPTATFNVAPPSVSEGAVFSLSLTSPNDASSVDTTAGFTYAFDCGSGYGAIGSSSTTVCTTNDNGTRTVKAKIRDKDGGETEYTASVTVTNVAPSVTLSGPTSANEGGTASYSYTWTDPGSADTFPAAGNSVDCGPKGTASEQVFTPASKNGSFKCTFSDDSGAGTFAVSATVKDDDGGTGTGTKNVSVANVAPTAANDNPPAVNEGGTVTLNVLANDTDPAGSNDPLSVTGKTNGQSGTVTCGAGGSCTYTPNNADFFGTDSFTYTVGDGDGGSSVGTVNVQITAVNDAPVATDDSATTDEDTPLVINDPNSLAANDDKGAANENGQTLTVTAVSNPTNGTVSLAGGKITFTPAPNYNGPASFDYTVRDNGQTNGADDFKSDTGTVNVTVKAVNDAPDAGNITAANNDPVKEGDSKNYSVTATDVDGDTLTYAWTVKSGAAIVTGGAATDTATVKFLDGPDNVNLQVVISDGHGGEVTRNLDGNLVSVVNVAPTVKLDATNDLTVNEGSTHTYSYTISDPGDDTVQSVGTSCGSGGEKVLGSDTNTNTSGSFECVFPDGPASPSVSVQAKDSDGDSGNTDSQSVTVNNVAPTVSLTGDTTVNEDTTHRYSYTVSDPGADSHTVTSISCDSPKGTLVTGSSSYDSTAREGSFDCHFPDGPATANVTVRVADDDGAADTDNKAVTVEVVNVAPSVTAPANQSSDEGESHTFGLGTFTDPGPDSPWAVDVDWGDGSTHDADSKAATGSLGTMSHTYADNGTYTVAVKVTDKDGLSDTKSFTVNVENIAPTATFEHPAVDEGQDLVLKLTGASDASGADTTAGFEYAFDCNLDDANGYTAFGASNEANCPTNDDGTRSVGAKIRDKDGGVSTYEETATINNVAPSVTAASAQSSNEGEDASFDLGSFTDPGDDGPWQVTVNWGDGSDPTIFTSGTGSLGSKPHTYADNGTYTVSVKVAEYGGSPSDTETFQITVANVKPSISLTGDTEANEGTTHTYSYTVSDPGVNDTHTATTLCGTAGTKVQDSDAYSNATRSGSFKCYFPDGPATTDVKATVTDNNGDSDTDNQQVTVEVVNVAPTVSLSGDATADEGQTKTYTFTVTDPGDPDTFTVKDAKCGTGGVLVDGSLSVNAGGGSFDCRFPDGPASPEVSVQVTDSDNADSNVATKSVTVANVAPTLTLSASNPLTADEGQTKTYTYTVSDPGDDTYTVDERCGTGNTRTDTVTADSFDCTFPDGPASSTISAQATDSDNAAGNTDEQTVQVANVAPTVKLDATNDLTVNEGSTHTYSYTISDPGDDTVQSVGTSCGSGGEKVLGSDTNTNTSGSFECVFPDGPASPSVSVQAKDSDGDSGNTDSQSVTVNNVAPNVTLDPDNDQSVDEGTTHTYSYTVSDPGNDTFSVVATYPKCGTGGNLVPGSEVTTATGGSFKCAFPDGPATTDVAIKVADSDGASDTASEAVQIVAVANVNPSITAPADQGADEGKQTSFDLGSFTDPGPDSSWTVDVDWGDGSNASFSQSTTGSLGTLNHTYADGPAARTITVKVTDKDGGSDTKTFTVNVENVAPTVKLDATNDLTVDEGTTHTYSYTISDPGDDTVGSVTTLCGSGGEKVLGSDTNTNTSGSFECVFPDGPASPSVTVQATDSDGDAGNTDEQTVTINNVAPTVSFTGGPADVNENKNGSETYAFSVSDPGTDGFTVKGDPGCGTGGSLIAGSLTTTANGGSFQCRFSDGPATPTVQIQVRDADEASGSTTADSNTATKNVTVNNVAPKVNLTGPNMADEGQTKTYNFTLSDPGDDTFSFVSGTTNYPTCGQYGELVGTPTVAGGSFQCRFPDGPNTTDVAIKIQDDDGGISTPDVEQVDILPVTVENVAPTVTAPSNQTANEAASASFDLGTFTDPGQDSPWSVDVDWGDGTAHGTDSKTATGSLGSMSHTYADNGDYNVTVKVTDKNGASDSKSFTVQVSNVKPTVSAPNDDTGVEGSPKSFDLGTFSDAGANDSPWSVDVDWGDGSPVENLADKTAQGSLGNASHTYNDNGNYTVTVSVTDKDGGTGSNTFTVNVSNANPNVVLTGSTSANEGDTKSYSYTWTDPGSADTFPAADNSVSCGPKGTASDKVFTPASKSGSFKCTFTDDSGAGTFAVSATVTDDDGGPGSDTKQVSVTNVAPTITNVTSTSQNVLAGADNSLLFTGTATDPSSLDTNAGFAWQWALNGGTYGAFGLPNANTYRATFTGCGPQTVSAKARDKDGGVSAPFTTSAVNVYNGSFKAPLVDGTFNKVQKGQVVPVKISVGCGTTNLTGLSPHIQLLNGEASPENELGGTVVTTSVSSADTGQTMRPVDGGYIYNLRVPSDSAATVGKRYTIRVNPFGETGNNAATGMYIVIEIRK